jgi:hypothetical protein
LPLASLNTAAALSRRTTLPALTGRSCHGSEYRSAGAGAGVAGLVTPATESMASVAA